MSIAAIAPFPVFFDADGQPLQGGYVYIGTAGANPETTPQAVFWDDALTVPAVQPIRTVNGHLSRAGSPAIIYTANLYSVTVRNRNGVLVYTSLATPGVPVSAAMVPVVSAATLAAGLTAFGFSAYIQTLINDADAATALTTLGVSAYIQTLLNDADAATARTTLGVERFMRGLPRVTLTNFSNTTIPQIAAGSFCDVNGTLCQFAADTDISGLAAIADGLIYIKMVDVAGVVTPTATAAAPTWSDAKQGWYNGNDLYVGGLTKAAPNYSKKWLYGQRGAQSVREYGDGTVGVWCGSEFLITKVLNIGEWNMDSTHTKSVNTGTTSANIRSVLSIVILADNGIPYAFLTPDMNSADGTVQNEASHYGGYGIGQGGSDGDIIITRKAGGAFDSAVFDSEGGFNRGYLTVICAA
jgi:hypothetical protein